MRKVFFAAVAALFCLGANAQDKTAYNSLGDFSKLSVSGKLIVTVEHSDTSRVEVDFNGNDVGKFSINSQNGQLTLGTKASLDKINDIKVTVYAKELSYLKSNGADVTVKEGVTAKSMSVEAVGGSNMRMAVGAKYLDAKVNGNSRVSFAGRSENFTLSVATASMVDGKNLETVSTTVSAGSGSEAYVWATEKLKANSSAASSIFYRGRPPMLDTKKSLGGTINDIGE